MLVLTEARALAPYANCVLVPTMGALHEGHFALVRRAKSLAGAAPVLVTIFVNPTQFNDPKDLDRYPRTLEADAAGCAAAGADIIFAPPVAEIYPPGNATSPPRLPDVATKPGLEDAHRPGHFAGVCQVVKRLFDLTRPRIALFGEKDWQQLQVITAMVHQLQLDIQIVPIETIREPDGLAMSSRNVFLKGDERTRARALSEALAAARLHPVPADAEAAMSSILTQRGLTTDYAVVRDAATLGPFAPGRPGRALIAARLGSVRLIDNSSWPH